MVLNTRRESLNTLFYTSYIVLWALVVGLSLLMLLVFRQFGIVYLKSSDGVARSGIRIGTNVPDLTLTTKNGNDINLSKYTEPVVLLFTSPGCGPCKQLLAKLNDYLIEYPKMNIIVFSNDTNTDDVLPNLRCPIIPLPDRKLYEEVFKGEVTPFAFLLDENRKVVSKGVVSDMSSIENLYKASKKSTVSSLLKSEVSA